MCFCAVKILQLSGVVVLWVICSWLVRVHLLYITFKHFIKYLRLMVQIKHNLKMMMLITSVKLICHSFALTKLQLHELISHFSQPLKSTALIIVQQKLKPRSCLSGNKFFVELTGVTGRLSFLLSCPSIFPGGLPDSGGRLPSWTLCLLEILKKC